VDVTKRRGKRRSKPKDRPSRKTESTRRRDSELELALQRAQRWIDRDRPKKAVDLLEPLLDSHPDDADLHALLGYAWTHLGDLWGALSEHETAWALSHNPSYLLPLAVLYLEADLSVHALRAFRQMIEQEASTPMMNEVRASVASLEQDLVASAHRLNIPIDDLEQGLYHMEEAHLAASKNDYKAAIAANRRAIKQLGDYPPPHNNLSQALFFDGQTREAVSEARRVLSNYPENLQALSNAIRFLTWMGRQDEARDLWSRLEHITPQSANDRLKKAEAAAVLAEHERVYQTLEPLDKSTAPEDILPDLMSRAQLFLAVAEANTGRQQSARRRLRALRQEAAPFAAEYLAALNEGRSGLGWADKFPYFHLAELLPYQQVEALIDLASREQEMPPGRFRRRMERFVESFPQIVQVGEKMIWEEQRPDAGIMMLRTIGTPEAYAALRRFGLSQAGGDKARLEALTALVEAGEIEPGESVRAWLDGEWREIELRVYEATDAEGRLSDYAPEVVDLLNRGAEASVRGDREQAEELFERVLELDRNVKEAYNNLGAIYAQRGEHEKAKKMFRQAIAIDPLYVFPRCNLAMYLLDDEKIEQAEEMVKPLSEAMELLPQEVAFYNFTWGRILTYQGEYDDARRAVKAALKIQPDYEPAQGLLEWIEELDEWDKTALRWRRSADSYWEQQRERDLAWRERLQESLTTSAPTLAEALPLYTKNALTGMAYELMPWGGWSSLRKAELIDEIIDALTDRENLERIVENLDKAERNALQMVLGHGGSMPWQAFDARHGNDLEESRYWKWHTPETTMGRLRLYGLLVEATVDDELRVAVPSDLREDLRRILGQSHPRR
jgi:tetratricopeptide (TPR) repeat protein